MLCLQRNIVYGHCLGHTITFTSCCAPLLDVGQEDWGFDKSRMMLQLQLVSIIELLNIIYMITRFKTNLSL